MNATAGAAQPIHAHDRFLGSPLMPSF